MDAKSITKEQRRKELKRAFAPEVLSELPPRRTLGKGEFGIRFSYNGIGRGHVFTRWYEKRSGRDQAFRGMQRASERRDGRRQSIYKLLEKIDQIGHGKQ